MKLEKFYWNKFCKNGCLCPDDGVSCTLCEEITTKTIDAAHEFYQKQVEGEFKVGDEVWLINDNKEVEKQVIMEIVHNLTGTYVRTNCIYNLRFDIDMCYKTKTEALKALEGEDGK